MALSKKDYQQLVRALSERLIKAQTPIRVLDAIQWDDNIRRQFFKSKCRKLPPVGADYYDNRPLRFEPLDKLEELQNIERDAMKQLGQLNPLGAWMRKLCREYQLVVRLLMARGTKDFCIISQDLYGASSDVFHAGDPTVADLAGQLASLLKLSMQSPLLEASKKIYSAEQAVEELNRRLESVFSGCGVRVMVSDGIVADAAAGSDYIKLRSKARFSERELDVLEAHEGWVHIGTTLNGQRQPSCLFLSKAPPSATVTQEGLAVLTEVMSQRSSPHRLYRLTQRVNAIRMVEDGADFVEVFHNFIDQGDDPDEVYQLCYRVFRGSMPDSGPFTKDLSYLKGFVVVFNFIRLAIARARPEVIPLLFCGKITIDDMKVVPELVASGLIAPPTYLPPMFKDLNGITALLSFSRFLSGLDFAQLERDYAPLIG